MAEHIIVSDPRIQMIDIKFDLSSDKSFDMSIYISIFICFTSLHNI